MRLVLEIPLRDGRPSVLAFPVGGVGYAVVGDEVVDAGEGVGFDVGPGLEEDGGDVGGVEERGLAG